MNNPEKRIAMSGSKTRCTAPIYLTKDPSAKPIRCRKCEGCRRAFAREWVLASMAEREFSTEVWTMTLSYAPVGSQAHGGRFDNRLHKSPNNEFLFYSDVQKFFKRLRVPVYIKKAERARRGQARLAWRADEFERMRRYPYSTPRELPPELAAGDRAPGYSFQFICAGEYGGAKGRSHWHLIIFWKCEPPDKGEVLGYSDAGKAPMRHFKYWPHGHVVIDELTGPAQINYVAKYIQKGMGHAGKFTCSKRPGIGSEYWDDHARRHADQRAFPIKNNFSIRGTHIQRPYISAMSNNRFRRYREIQAQVHYENGGSPIELPTFEKILPQVDRAEMAQRAGDSVAKASLLPSASGFAVIAARANKFALLTYQRPGPHGVPQRMMLLKLDRRAKALPWMDGVLHTSTGMISMEKRGGASDVLHIPITDRQFADLYNKRMPAPESDPAAKGDWLTPDAARLRAASGRVSRASLLPAIKQSPRKLDLASLQWACLFRKRKYLSENNQARSTALSVLDVPF